MEQREDNKNDIASRRLKNLFGEALGDLSSVEETETAWQAFASRRRQERVRTLVFGFAAVTSRGITFVLGLFSGKLSIPRSRSVCFCKFA